MLEKTLESALNCKEIQPVHPKGDQSWLFIGRTDVEAETPILWPPDCEELTHWKRPWCWERLRAGGEGDDIGWDGWMASLTQWIWVWVNSRRWTGRPGMLQFMGLQRVGHDWATELNWWLKSFTLCFVVVVQSLCLTLCNLLNCSTAGFLVLYYLPEFSQTHVHWVSDAIQSPHPLSPSPLALNLS